MDGSTNVCFKPEDFVDSDKKILQKLFNTISKITQWAPTSRDQPKAEFLIDYQFVYRINGRPARLVKRSAKIRYRQFYCDYYIVGIWPNGSVDCEYIVGDVDGEQIVRSTSFKLWEFTDVMSYTILHKLARGAELRRDACYWDEAARINKSAATEICNACHLVRIRAGDVMLVPARAWYGRQG